MVESIACAALITKGPRQGLPATGTPTGWNRHKRAGEPPCDACVLSTREAALNYYNANREVVIERVTEWRQANRDKAGTQTTGDERTANDHVRDLERRCYRQNQESILERKRLWRLTNLEAERARDRREQRANPERHAEKVRRRRALKRAALTITFTVDQLAEKFAYWGNRCWMCGGEADSVDHVIPLARGGAHCLSNLRPACRSCNSSKGDRWPVLVTSEAALRDALTRPVPFYAAIPDTQ